MKASSSAHLIMIIIHIICKKYFILKGKTVIKTNISNKNNLFIQTVCSTLTGTNPTHPKSYTEQKCGYNMRK